MTRADPQRLEELLAECLQSFDTGGRPALEALLQRHPEQRAELDAHLRRLRQCGLLDRDAPEPRLGASVGGGEFELGALLGGGGMGVVYRARQPSLDREVALKRIRPDRVHHDKARERFRREAAALAGLHHPGIVQVHAFGEDDGAPWFAMELIEGRSLAQILAGLAGRSPQGLGAADLGVLPDAVPADLDWPRAIAELAARAADALHAAHQQGIVHRDVKPSNLMLADDGRLLLFDFGLTSLADTDGRLTLDDEPVGSPAYMAPEQLRGEHCDARTDVYGLGVTLHELLALELPFAPGTAGDLPLRERILRGEATPLRHQNRRVPADLEVVVAKARAVEPRHRYRSAAALRDDLRRFLAGQPVHARWPGPLERGWRSMRRNPARSVAAVAVLLLVVGGPSLLAWQEARARRQVAVERDAAERHLDFAVRAIERFLAEFGGDELVYVAELDARGRALLDEATATLEALHAQRPDDRRVRLAAARAWRRSAWQARRRGELDAAWQQIARARELLVTVPETDDEAVTTRVHVLRMAARIARARGRLDEAEALLADALAAFGERVDPALEAPLAAELRLHLAIARSDLGRLRSERGAAARAVPILEDAVAVLRDDRLPSADRTDLLAQALRRLATARSLTDDLAGERAARDAAREVVAQALDGGVAGPELRGLAADLELSDAWLAWNTDRDREARDAARHAAEEFERLATAHPEVRSFAIRLVDASLLGAQTEGLATAAGRQQLQRAGEWLARLGPHRRDVVRESVRYAALRCDPVSGPASAAQRSALEAALARLAAVAGEQPTRDDLAMLALGHQVLAVVLLADDPTAAAEVARLAVVHAAALESLEGSTRPVLRRLGYAHAARADALAALDATAEHAAAAASHYALSIARRDAALARWPDDRVLRDALAGTLCNAAYHAHRQGETDRAAALSARAIEEAHAAGASAERQLAAHRLGVELLLVEQRLESIPDATAALLALGSIDAALTAAELLAQAAWVDGRAADRFDAAAVDAARVAVERGLVEPQRLIESPHLRRLHRRADFMAVVRAARDAGGR